MGVCMCGGGHACMAWGMCAWGLVCMGACVHDRGHVCQGLCMKNASGQYTFYWNAFVFLVLFSIRLKFLLLHAGSI